MSKLFPSLKGRHWTVYFFMAIYAVAAVFTVVESALPGDLSSSQSSFVGNILAWFANLFPAAEPTPVHPTGIRLLSSSSYLDALEDDPSSNEICLGTTTMLTFDLEYPEKKENTYEYASFRAEEVKGGENYSLVVDPSSLVVRIVSNGETAEDCEIAIYGDEGVMTTFSFDIVPRPSPREFSLENVPTSVQAGTAASFDLVLSDPIGERSDYELRRYFDVSSLEVEADEGIHVDPRGAIYVERGVTPGPHAFSIGGKSYEIDVTSPIGESYQIEGIALSEIEGELALNDYDYEQSGVYFSASYLGTSLPEESLFLVSLDEMKARAVDASGTSFNIKGYRAEATEEDKLVVRVESALLKDGTDEPLFAKTIELTSKEILPSSIESLKVGNSTLENGGSLAANAGSSLSVSMSLLGSGGSQNVYDRSISVVSSDPGVASVSGSPSLSPRISFKKEGSVSFTVSSVANPNLEMTFSATVEGPVNVDPGDKDFAISVRKNIGHLSLFAFLGGIGALFFALYFADPHRTYLAVAFSGGIAAALAFLTEAIQILTPMRGPSLVDVGIDLAGAFIGLLVFLLVYGIVLLIKHKPWKKG